MYMMLSIALCTWDVPSLGLRPFISLHSKHGPLYMVNIQWRIQDFGKGGPLHSSEIYRGPSVHLQGPICTSTGAHKSIARAQGTSKDLLVYQIGPCGLVLGPKSGPSIQPVQAYKSTGPHKCIFTGPGPRVCEFKGQSVCRGRPISLGQGPIQGPPYKHTYFYSSPQGVPFEAQNLS